MTEREKVLAQREAYLKGRLDQSFRMSRGDDDWSREWEGKAAKLFPLPKVERTRRLKHAEGIFYVKDGLIWCDKWHSNITVCKADPQLLTDLYGLAVSPREVVDDDGEPNA